MWKDIYEKNWKKKKKKKRAGGRWACEKLSPFPAWLHSAGDSVMCPENVPPPALPWGQQGAE